jgi:hypothetical protein
MLPFRIYCSILAACWLYALLKGGAPERVGATVIGVGSILSLVAVSGPGGRFGAVEVGVLMVDLAASVAFVILALRAERYWPLWVAALQVIGTTGHAAKLMDPSVIRSAYAFVLAFWTYPMLLLVVVGTWQHQKRLTRFGVDRSWSNSFGRSGRQPPAGPAV